MSPSLNIFRYLRESLAPQKSRYRLAKDLGLSPSAVSRIENNERQPSLLVIKKYRDYFKVTADFLMDAVFHVHHQKTLPKIPLVEQKEDQDTSQKTWSE